MIATNQHESTEGFKHVEVEGTRIAYRERGSGDPVILVHGSVNDLSIWDPILDRIAERHRAIAYSRRWAWPNEPIPDGVADSVGVHAVDLAALIEKLDLGPVSLVGNSFGAFTSLVVARDRPDLVRRLVVQEPPVIPLLLGFPPGPPRLLKLLVTRPATGLPVARTVFTGLAPAEAAAKRGAVEASLETFLRRVVLGDERYERMPEWVNHHMRLNLGTHAAQFLNNGGLVPFTAADARSIRVPTLVMNGAESPKLFQILDRELAGLLPHVRMVVVPGAGHLMQVDNPEATAAAILDFLSEGAIPGEGSVP